MINSGGARILTRNSNISWFYFVSMFNVAVFVFIFSESE